MKERMFGRNVPVFYSLACIVWKLIEGYVVKTSYISRLQERFDKLYPDKNKSELVKQYMCYKLSLVLMIICTAVIMGFVLWCSNQDRVEVVDTIKRNEYWGQQKEESMLVEVEGEKGQQAVTIMVPERKYAEDEMEGLLEEMAQSLEKTILMENASLDSVSGDLELVTSVPDTEVEVSWSMDTSDYIMPDGTLIAEAVTRDGIVVNLTADLSYEDKHCIHSFAVCLKKPHMSQSEQLISDITKEVEMCNVSQAGAKELKLPTQIQGKKIQFKYAGETDSGKMIIAALILAVLLFFVKDERLQKELDKRKKQMLLDYSEIVSKLTLLLGAGMTIRMALEKIARDYDRKKAGGVGRRYAYDEILYVCREMQGGVSERAGIDMLGNRCQIPCYMKLCSLLQQNLKKGSKGMAQSLSYEVGQAFEERKNVAKKLGEEAGTKLLFPMILMLAIVMVILIVPAFLSF